MGRLIVPKSPSEGPGSGARRTCTRADPDGLARSLANCPLGLIMHAYYTKDKSDDILISMHTPKKE
jgi:hypothetical protein